LTIATPAVCYFRNASCSLNKKSMFLYDYNKLYCLKTFLLNFSVLVLTFSGGRSFMHQTSVILKGLFIYMWLKRTVQRIPCELDEETWHVIKTMNIQASVYLYIRWRKPSIRFKGEHWYVPTTSFYVLHKLLSQYTLHLIYKFDNKLYINLGKTNNLNVLGVWTPSGLNTIAKIRSGHLWLRKENISFTNHYIA
jgi:hypothetical protein